MRQGAQDWCTGMTLIDGLGKEVGGRVRIGNTCTPMADSCDYMTKPSQYCKIISLQLKKKKKEYWSGLPCPPPGDLPNSRTELKSPSL